MPPIPQPALPPMPEISPRFDAPSWEPLKALLGDCTLPPDQGDHTYHLCRLMAMFVQWQGDKAYYAYKHAETRRYLWLDAESRAYVYQGDGTFVAIELHDALDRTFGGWPIAVPRVKKPRTGA